MAAPTPTTTLHNTGHGFVQTWHAVWATTDNITDGVLVDLSALAYTTRLVIHRIHINATAGISVKIGFDTNASGEFFYRYPIAGSGPVEIDYTDTPSGGMVKISPDDTDDLLLTTTSAASGDEVMVTVWGRCD